MCVKNKQEAMKYLGGVTSYYIKKHNFSKVCSIGNYKCIAISKHDNRFGLYIEN